MKKFDWILKKFKYKYIIANVIKNIIKFSNSIKYKYLNKKKMKIIGIILNKNWFLVEIL